MWLFSQVVKVGSNLLLFVSCSSPEQEMEERKCNYERYRGLVQNDFASSKYLKLRSWFSLKKIFNSSGSPITVSNSIRPLLVLFTTVSLRLHAQRAFPHLTGFISESFCAFKLPDILPQSLRSSVYTRFIWMSSTVDCKNQMKMKRRSMCLKVLEVLGDLWRALKSVSLSLSHVSVNPSLQTSWKKGHHWLHLWRQHRDRTWAPVRQRWRQFREQRVRRGWRHPRYRWVNRFKIELHTLRKLKL